MYLKREREKDFNMGCKPVKDSAIPNMSNTYTDARLPHPPLGSYRSDFEKEFFMIVNLMRNNPSKFVRHVKNYEASSLCQNPAACRTTELKLKECGEL